MTVALVNGRVLGDDGFLDNRAVLVEDGRIVDIVAGDDLRSRSARGSTSVDTSCCRVSSTRR
jgi:N-acetylglucosamine-6-phosphate deacetylase